MLDTLWVMISLLLLFLLVLGLCLIYSGLARFKNSVASGFQAFFAIITVSLVWIFFGFSGVFSPSQWGGVIGRWDPFLFLDLKTGMGHLPMGSLRPELFFLFHLLFAVIACIVLLGSVLERISLRQSIVLTALWMTFVYVPVAHWVWGPGGWMALLGAVDFAGGLVVHVSSGVSALAATIQIGRRKDYFQLIEKHSQSLIFLGTGLVWLGWFGFNAGSALAMNEWAVNAFIATFFAPVASALIWSILDLWHTPHRVSYSSLSLAIISGLVVVTPMAAYVSPLGALCSGALAGLVSHYGVRLMHRLFKQDDVADVFSTHALSGILGSLMMPLTLTAAAKEILSIESLWKANFTAALVVSIYSFALTWIILALMNRWGGRRVNELVEEKGLDLHDHGERALNL